MALEQKVIKQMIKSIKSNNQMNIESAFEKFYEYYKNLIFYISFKIVKRRDIAEEITNETFLRFFNHLFQIDEKKNLKYLLVTIAKNLSLNEIKRANKELVLDNELILSVNEVSSNWEEVISPFKKYLLEEEIDIITYHFVYNYSFREIAELKNVTTNSITSKYHRAIKKMRNYYQERGSLL